MTRQHNFSAGPAVLPEPVLQELQQALPEYDNSGLGLMEISHRSPAFSAIRDSAEARLRALLDIPEDYAVLFFQGGASLQFNMSATNLLGPQDKADFLVTGVWAKKALKEAARFADCQPAYDGAHDNYASLPEANELTVRADAEYLHYTSNNTIFGTQWHHTPSTDKPLVVDMSSDICSRPIDISAHALIYAGAQKNLGPSGVTVVIASPWVLERSAQTAPTQGHPVMLDYVQIEKAQSLYNTPNTFGIYALERVLAWQEAQGGLTALAKYNANKAQALYDELDSNDFWRPHAQPNVRSQMNVTWRTPSEELDKKFVSEATAAGLHGLKGHRLVGGIRASIYNACPQASIDALIAFMRQFAAQNS